MTNDATGEAKVTLDGAEISIDGDRHYVESGELVLERDYLKGPTGEVVQEVQRQITIDVELYEPDEERMTNNIESWLRCPKPKCGGTAVVVETVHSARRVVECEICRYSEEVKV